MEQSKEYYVFISYKREDKKEATTNKTKGSRDGSPQKIGDTLSSRQFNVEGKHSNIGGKYLLVER